MPRRLRVIGGLRAVEAIIEEYKRMIYQYNSLIAGTGYYLKPMHIVTRRTESGYKRYIYIGRYWWKVSYAGKKGKTSRIRWIYIGRDKPPELQNYPDPPRHPIEGLRFVAEGEDIILDERTYQRFSWLFKGYRVEPVD